MQKLVLFIFSVALLTGCGNGKSGSVSAVKEYTIHVLGNCEKCKANIEKACQVKGATDANWGVESKLLTVKLDTTAISLNTLMEEVAKAGYDTETKLADDYAYGALPECCQYERRSDTK
jgi:periplasmic mercuric ion binding protein